MKVYILTETDAKNPAYIHSESFSSPDEARKRLKDLYHQNAVEGNPDAIEKAELSEMNASVFLSDGNSIHWSIQESEIVAKEPEDRKVFILTSKSNLKERGDFNGIVGVFQSLKQAQKSMAEDIETDLQNHPWIEGECNGSKDIFEYDFYEMKNMFASDPGFDFDATSATLKDDKENFVEYSIEERTIIPNY